MLKNKSVVNVERRIVGMRQQDISLEAYKTVFKEPSVIAQAYMVTILITLCGTALGLFIQTMTAYVLSRKDFAWRNRFSFFFYFTTLFNGGLVPSYILMKKAFRILKQEWRESLADLV